MIRWKETLGSAIVFALLLAAALAGVGYVVVARRFHATPEYQWRERVVRHAAELADRRRRLTAKAPISPSQAVENERRLAMEIARRTIPLERLTEQPGIGPGAVSLLRQAGVRDIPTALRVNLVAINGIGPQKAAQLRFGAEQLIVGCDAAFANGKSREGVEFASRAAEIRAETAQLCEEHSVVLAALDAAINAHREAERFASQVNLLRFLRGDRVTGLDAERMAKPFAATEAPNGATAPTEWQPSGTPDGIAPHKTASVSASTAGLQRKTFASSQAGDLLGELLKRPQSPSKSEPMRRHPHQDGLEAFTRFGVMIAMVDGRAAKSELNVVRQFLSELFGHEPELLRRIDPLVELATAGKPDVDAVLAEAKRVAADPAELMRLYRWAERIADASSGRNEREAALLARVAGEWAIDAPASKPLAGPPLSTPTQFATDPRTELGIPADVEVTVELVRRRYNLIVDQLDTSRLDGLGAEFTKLAALKRVQVETAALALLRPLGASLTPPAAASPAADPRHNPDLDAVFGA